MLIEIACLLLGATTIGVSHVFPYFQGAGGLASIIASCLLIYKRGDLRESRASTEASLLFI